MISIKKYAEMQNDPIFLRKSYSYGVEDTVREILDGVKQKGDAALFAFTHKYDHAELAALQVSESEIEAACAAVDPGLIEVMRESAENIRAFHSRQVRTSFVASGCCP